MNLNFLQQLGLLGPNKVNPQTVGAAPSVPQNLLAGIPGYGDASAPQAPQQNALQGLLSGASQNADTLAQPASPAASPAPRERRSILDTVGRIADVFAKVGGADALYQPTLDARQDRGFAIEDRSRGIDMDKIKLASAQGELGDAGNARLGQAIRGLQAITSANPQADIAKVWPILAQQAGVDPERAAALSQQISTNPDLLKGLAGTVGATKEFGLQPFYAKDSQGNLSAFQMSKDGTIQPVALPEGSTPIDPLKFVDTGGTMTGVGTRSGNPTRILPKTEAPGKAADRAQRGVIANANNASRERIAAMPARGKTATAGAAGATAVKAQQASELIDELDSIYTKLDKSGASVNPNNGAVGNVLARVRASGAGQLVEGAIGTEAQTLRDRVNSIRPALMQSLAKATGMTGKQLDSNADVKLFMQTVTDPTKSTQANRAAISGLRRFLAEQAPSAAPRQTAPVRSKPRPQKSGSGGWSVVGVK